MENNEIAYKKAAEQLRKGEPLFGKDGALAPMQELILNAALEGEMDAHLPEEERSKGNRRTALHRSSYTQLRQVYRKQAPERISS